MFLCDCPLCSAPTIPALWQWFWVHLSAPSNGTGSHVLGGSLLPAIQNVNAIQSFNKLSATLKLGFKSRGAELFQNLSDSTVFSGFGATQGSVCTFLGFVIYLSSSFSTCCLACMLFAYTFPTWWSSHKKFSAITSQFLFFFIFIFTLFSKYPFGCRVRCLIVKTLGLKGIFLSHTALSLVFYAFMYP